MADCPDPEALARRIAALPRPRRELIVAFVAELEQSLPDVGWLAGDSCPHCGYGKLRLAGHGLRCRWCAARVAMAPAAPAAPRAAPLQKPAAVATARAETQTQPRGARGPDAAADGGAASSTTAPQSRPGPRRQHKSVRNDAIRAAAQAGATISAIAREHNISRARVREILAAQQSPSATPCAAGRPQRRHKPRWGEAPAPVPDRRDDPVSEAQQALQRRGYIVHRAAVIGGSADAWMIDGRQVSEAELLARAAKLAERRS